MGPSLQERDFAVLAALVAGLETGLGADRRAGVRGNRNVELDLVERGAFAGVSGVFGVLRMTVRTPVNRSAVAIDPFS
jgi:hypothetical protein